MTPEQFTYWLKGFFEISNSEELTPTQVLIVKDHLNLVFNKVTPDRKVDLGTYCKVDTGIANKYVSLGEIHDGYTAFDIHEDLCGLPNPEGRYCTFNLPSECIC